jgi:hypothetical protein
MVYIVQLWYVSKYRQTINNNQIVGTLKVVVVSYFSMTNQHMEIKILNMKLANSHDNSF